MNHRHVDSHKELPSMGKLIRSTILAIIMAAIILISIVLPAEYGIDPTGIGKSIGLVNMGEIKVSLAQEAAADRARDNVQEPTDLDESESEKIPAQEAPGVQDDEMTLSLVPNEGKEIKLVMKKGDEVNYQWWTSGGRANFDTHADSKPLEISYHNYEKGSSERSDGVLEAAFDGNHGWFWRNRTSESMTVTLRVRGTYSDITQVE